MQPSITITIPVDVHLTCILQWIESNYKYFFLVILFLSTNIKIILKYKRIILFHQICYAIIYKYNLKSI